MEYEIVGAIKIKDGLFLGDEYAAQDLEFVVTNKVSRIINCAGKQIPNHWNNIGVQYVTFGWLETDSQVIFDPKDEVLQRTYRFIDDTLNQGDAVLIHSVRGHNRSVCIIAAYLMRKYRWTLYKTLEFLHSRRPDLEIRASFFNQLLALENRLSKLGLGAKTYNWKEIAESNQNDLENEEILLKNTFLNSKNQEVAEYNDTNVKKVETKIRWADQQTECNNVVEQGQLSFQQRQYNLHNNSLNRLFIPCYEKCKFRPNRYNNKTIFKYKSIVKGKQMEYDFDPPQEQSYALNNSNKPAFKGFRTQLITRNQHSAKPKNASSKDLTQMRILKNQNNQINQQQQFQRNDIENNNFINANTNINELNQNNQNQNINNKGLVFSNGIASKYQNGQKNTENISNKYQQSEDQKLQASLNQIANRQLKESLRNNLVSDDQQLNNNNQTLKQNNLQKNNQSQTAVQKVYGQKLGRKLPQKNQKVIYSAQNNQEQRKIQGLQKFASKDEDEFNNNRNTGAENSFKSSQRIYAQNFGMRQPAMNNFLGNNNSSNQNKVEMPSINQPSNKNQFGFLYEQEKKNVKVGKSRLNRPSTAPPKKQENGSSKQPQNSFGVRSGFKPQNNTNYNDLVVTGQQRQRSAQQQNQESFLNKKQRITSPGNFYSNNSLSKQGKWKM